MRITNHRVRSYVEFQKIQTTLCETESSLPDGIDIATYGDYDHGVGRSYDLEKEI